MNNTTKPRLLNLKQAANLVTGLTEYRVRQLCLSGEIRHYRFGKKIMLSERELLKYFDETI
jgi:hypothetical protein